MSEKLVKDMQDSAAKDPAFKAKLDADNHPRIPKIFPRLV